MQRKTSGQSSSSEQGQCLRKATARRRRRDLSPRRKSKGARALSTCASWRPIDLISFLLSAPLGQTVAPLIADTRHTKGTYCTQQKCRPVCAGYINAPAVVVVTPQTCPIRRLEGATACCFQALKSHKLTCKLSASVTHFYFRFRPTNSLLCAKTRRAKLE